MTSPYSEYLKAFIVQLNEQFVQRLKLKVPFSQEGLPGDRFGIIHPSELRPAEGRPQQVRAGFLLKELALDCILSEVSDSRIEASAIAAALMEEMESALSGINQYISVPYFSNLQSTRSPQAVVRPNSKNSQNWITRVVGSATVVYTVYINAEGNRILPPAQYLPKDANFNNPSIPRSQQH